MRSTSRSTQEKSMARQRAETALEQRLIERLATLPVPIRIRRCEILTGGSWYSRDAWPLGNGDSDSFEGALIQALTSLQQTFPHQAGPMETPYPAPQNTIHVIKEKE